MAKDTITMTMQEYNPAMYAKGPADAREVRRTYEP